MVRSMLVEIADRFRRNSDWEILEIYDEERGQYLLFTDGWKGESRDYGCFMHIEVREDGKIMLRRDGTDLDIGQQILNKGVSKKEMVIGFHSPKMRSWSDFALS
ncbi:MAG: XisI protein [Saprospiraceae bacterium]|nr:XisI protein [Saprospiraceae bacterium]